MAGAVFNNVAQCHQTALESPRTRICSRKERGSLLQTETSARSRREGIHLHHNIGARFVRPILIPKPRPVFLLSQNIEATATFRFCSRRHEPSFLKHWYLLKLCSKDAAPTCSVRLSSARIALSVLGVVFSTKTRIALE